MQKIFSRLVQTAAVLAVMLLGASVGYAQDITVKLADVMGRPGETATVGVKLTGVEASTAINSFGFTVTTDTGITFTGIDDSGTLAGAAGFSSSANPLTGAVGGFAQGTSISTSGTLIYLKFTLDTVSTGTVTLTGFQLNNGDPSATAVPATAHIVSLRIMSASTHSVTVDRDFKISFTMEDALVDADNVNSFSLDFTYDPAVLHIDKTVGDNGVIKAATLTSGWTVNGNDVGGANSGTFRVAGFGAEITGAGVLFQIAATAVGIGESDLTITAFNPQPGSPSYALRVGMATVVANSAPVAAAGTLTTNEDTSVDFTMSATDADGDAVTFTVGSPTNGSVTVVGAVVTYTPTVNYFGIDSYTYTANDGLTDSAAATVSITVTPVNDAPVFTAEMGDLSMLLDAADATFAYTATDVDGDALAYSVVTTDGASIVGGTGAFTFDPSAAGVGAHAIQVSVSDGTVSVDAAEATLTVLQVDALYTPLAGVHEVGGVFSPGSGWASGRLVESSDLFEISGAFSGLSGAFSAAHVHMGGLGVAGNAIITIAVTAGATDREGSFNMSVDLSAVTYPTGVTQANFVAAIRNGGAYVNVHSSAHGPGELRGQLLRAMNTAPSGAIVRGPASVVISGDPGAALFSFSWLPVTDPDGDAVAYLFEMATDAAFTQNVFFNSYGSGTGFEFTVADAAALFDDISGGAPGTVDVGGSVTLYQRVITSDGSLWTAGATDEMTMTRGIVTGTEFESELPTEFVLKGNYPNPFNPSTTIQFDLPETAEVSVIVLDLLGRQVMSVPVQPMSAGASLTIQLSASSLASGIYIYRVEAKMQNSTQMKVGTMTLIK